VSRRAAATPRVRSRRAAWACSGGDSALLRLTFAVAVGEHGQAQAEGATPPRIVLDTTLTLVAGRVTLVTLDEQAGRFAVLTATPIVQ